MDRLDNIVELDPCAEVRSNLFLSRHPRQHLLSRVPARRPSPNIGLPNRRLSPRFGLRRVAQRHSAERDPKLADRATHGFAAFCRPLRAGRKLRRFACAPGAGNERAGPWDMILSAKLAGKRELDLGRSDLDNPGLIAFKEKWGRGQPLLYSRTCAVSTVPERRCWIGK